MRLYTLTGATSVSNEDHGTFDVDPKTGAIEVPEALGRILHNVFLAGKRAWEDDVERAKRLADEELARRKDPATLLAAVEALTEKVAGGGDSGSSEPAPAAPAKKAAVKKAPAKKAAGPAAS